MSARVPDHAVAGVGRPGPRRCAREVLTRQPPEAATTGRPPLLFVPGFGHGAWAFAEHWLEHAAERGFPAYAMSLRGHGDSGAGAEATLRAYAHDVVQVAAGLPRQAVLVGHGAGALVVAHALARYPARAGVLVAPVFGGWATLGAALRAQPARHAAGAVRRAGCGCSRGQLFSRELPDAEARRYAGRLGRAGRPGAVAAAARPARRSRRSATRRCWWWAARTTGWCRGRRWTGWPAATAARRCCSPGMGHDLMLDARWRGADRRDPRLAGEGAGGALSAAWRRRLGRRPGAAALPAGWPAGAPGRRRRSRCGAGQATDQGAALVEGACR